MNRFIKYFFLLLCFLPKLAMGMELQIGDVQNKDVQIYHEIVKKDKGASDNLRMNISEQFKLKTINVETPLPLDILFKILNYLNVKDQIHFIRHSKAFSEDSTTLYLYCRELKLKSTFDQEFALQDSNLHDGLFERLFICTKDIAKLAKNNHRPESQQEATKILEDQKENACKFLTDYKDNKGGFKQLKTLKYEDDYIYLSEMYNNDYEPNNCCLPCGVYSKEYTKQCFKPIARCLHGIGRGCSSCADSSLNFVTSSSGGPATLCCLGTFCCPCITTGIIAVAACIVGFAIPCCCYTPCICAGACYDFKDD